MQRYRYVLRRDEGHVLRRVLQFEVNGLQKRGRPKKIWRGKVEEESKGVSLRREDTPNQARWRESGCYGREVEKSAHPTSVNENKTCI